jgi:hypothetical protein
VLESRHPAAGTTAETTISNTNPTFQHPHRPRAMILFPNNFNCRRRATGKNLDMDKMKVRDERYLLALRIDDRLPIRTVPVTFGLGAFVTRPCYFCCRSSTKQNSTMFVRSRSLLLHSTSARSALAYRSVLLHCPLETTTMPTTTTNKSSRLLFKGLDGGDEIDVCAQTCKLISLFSKPTDFGVCTDEVTGCTKPCCIAAMARALPAPP